MMQKEVLNRHNFLKISGVSLAGLSMAGINITRAEDNRKPNVVFILADDLGWTEMGCYGNKFNEMPMRLKFLRNYAGQKDVF